MIQIYAKKIATFHAAIFYIPLFAFYVGQKKRLFYCLQIFICKELYFFREGFCPKSIL